MQVYEKQPEKAGFQRGILKYNYMARAIYEQKESCEATILRMALNST